MAIMIGISVLFPVLGAAAEATPREPLLYGLASFFIPGLGQFLNDEPDKALANFLVAVAIPVVCPIFYYILPPDYYLRWSLCVLLQMGWHAYSAIDAYQVAKRFNEEHGFAFGDSSLTLATAFNSGTREQGFAVVGP